MEGQKTEHEATDTNCDSTASSTHTHTNSRLKVKYHYMSPEFKKDLIDNWELTESQLDYASKPGEIQLCLCLFVILTLIFFSLALCGVLLLLVGPMPRNMNKNVRLLILLATLISFIAAVTVGAAGFCFIRRAKRGVQKSFAKLTFVSKDKSHFAYVVAHLYDPDKWDHFGGLNPCKVATDAASLIQNAVTIKQYEIGADALEKMDRLDQLDKALTGPKAQDANKTKAGSEGTMDYESYYGIVMPYDNENEENAIEVLSVVKDGKESRPSHVDLNALTNSSNNAINAANNGNDGRTVAQDVKNIINASAPNASKNS